MPGNPAKAGDGGRQHQPADPLRCLMGELLRDAATEGDTENVDLVMAEGVEQVLDRGG